MKRAETAVEPPSCLRPAVFMIGRNCKGNWVVQAQSGVCGGLFANRAAALKFMKFESENHPHTIVRISGILELNTGFAPVTSEPAAHRPRRYKASKTC